MTTPNTTERFKVGAMVKIRDSGYRKARIVEIRGPLGPNGAIVYRVQVRSRPHAAYTEVLEDQLETVRPGQ